MPPLLSNRLLARLRPHAPSLVPGLLAVGLMLVWAVHNGGYDADTWYWGALLLCAMLATALWIGRASIRPSRTVLIALAAFGLYVAWSYLSITWAESKGDALQGSNRALLYLLIFALLAVLPWTAEAAVAALLTFAAGVGVIALVLLVRLASADRVGALVIEGRLAAPTGYFNSTAALFTIGALLAIALATRRELPSPVRGLMLAMACADLQLAVVVQSRGWLFTLPLIAIVAIAIVPDRLRVAGAAAIPVIATLAPLRRLLDVFKNGGGPGLSHAAERAGQTALAIWFAAFVAGTLIAMGDEVLKVPSLSAALKRRLGAGLAAVAVGAIVLGGVLATHGHPIRFIERQWNGFSHVQTNFSAQSHFVDVGSGRYDYWRVALDAFVAHPFGGLGQDNFADYYVVHRRTTEEPAWTHSLEMRLLAQTGLVGTALFVAFLGAALRAALRRRVPIPALARAAAATALFPLAVWLIHGSVDWFWEIPALSGPALGFLGMATALASPPVRGRDDERPAKVLWRASTGPAPSRRPVRAGTAVGGVALLAGAVVALGLPYLSVREVSQASDVAPTNPSAALRDLRTAADLDPLSAVPGRIAGTIALRNGDYKIAAARFEQAISREPDGWFSWLGAGLAASALGDRTVARHDFAVAARLNSRQPAVVQALARVDTEHPLTPAQALRMLVFTQ
jgi:hypothetical protein